MLKQLAGAVLIGVAAALVFVALTRPARAQVLFDCSYLAELMRRAATYRDAGAEVEKTVEVFLAHEIPPSRPHGEALAREIRRVWREDLSEHQAEQATFWRCRAQLGDMGAAL